MGVVKLHHTKTQPVTFKKGGKLQGLGKNTSSKMVGPRGRKISILRSK